MKQSKIKKSALISAGSFYVSIGRDDVTDVAMISKKSGRFAKLSHGKNSERLKTIKKSFKTFLNSDETFTFQHMPEYYTAELINVLKS